MKVLYVSGSNLRKNTSANISHNAYVQGLIENGCEVDIIMANTSWGEHDSEMPFWNEAKYYEFNSVSYLEKLKRKVKGKIDTNNRAFAGKELSNTDSISTKTNSREYIRRILKKIFEIFFLRKSVYELEETWLKNAMKFRGKISYDIIISNSSPEASHKLVQLLLSKKRIKGKRWIQIWEDPWFYDVYGGVSEKKREEEHSLLQTAEEIYYVSTLTLKYQKEYFSDCAHKMKHIPLPFLRIEDNSLKDLDDDLMFGYFGDYYSNTRNILPFYQALTECGANGIICGDSDIHLVDTEKIKINGRVTLDKLKVFQNQTSFLVHLSNVKGGQIPGKIYHYSATTKPILFILDGTMEEIKEIKSYFEKFNRYFFCTNDKHEIKKTIKILIEGKFDLRGFPVKEFEPKQVVANLLRNP